MLLLCSCNVYCALSTGIMLSAQQYCLNASSVDAVCCCAVSLYDQSWQSIRGLEKMMLVICKKTEKPSNSFRGRQKREEGRRKGGSKQGRMKRGREVVLPGGSIVVDISVNGGKNWAAQPITRLLGEAQTLLSRKYSHSHSRLSHFVPRSLSHTRKRRACSAVLRETRQPWGRDCSVTCVCVCTVCYVAVDVKLDAGLATQPGSSCLCGFFQTKNSSSSSMGSVMCKWLTDFFFLPYSVYRCV